MKMTLASLGNALSSSRQGSPLGAITTIFARPVAGPRLARKDKEVTRVQEEHVSNPHVEQRSCGNS